MQRMAGFNPDWLVQPEGIKAGAGESLMDNMRADMEEDNGSTAMDKSDKAMGKSSDIDIDLGIYSEQYQGVRLQVYEVSKSYPVTCSSGLPIPEGCLDKDMISLGNGQSGSMDV
jgi:hypothetical protein